MSKLQVYVDEKGLINGFVIGSASSAEPAPKDMTKENRHEWVKENGEWLWDKKKADELRKEEDEKETTE